LLINSFFVKIPLMEKRILDLTGHWQFKEYPASARRMRDLDEQSWLDCSVPSSIYTCLVKAGVIKLSDLNSNPQDFLWPSEKPWIFQKIFDLSAEFFELDRIELVFEGLDTFCQVWLNDKLVGRSDNMFCLYRFDVKTLLKEKNNRLLVKCDSPIEVGNRLMNRFGMLGRDDCSLPLRSYVRKAQCQFGWDFAPPLPGCGIWQAVRIEGLSAACLRDIHIRTIEADDGRADIRISARIEKFINQSSTSCRLTVFNPAGNIAAKGELDFSDRNNISTVLKIKPVSLWQPALYGSQPIYELKAELFSGNQLIETSLKKFGIRTIHLNQSSEKIGSSFEFIVNNHPVYVRGASWIPASLFIGSTTDSDYERILTAAKEANINMLRVWGGGIYETETFYNICDRLGIMVWQDFAFACAYYPDRSWFGRMIKTEATQNITRLRNHPSLMLWCGNNEIDWQHTTGGIGKNYQPGGQGRLHYYINELFRPPKNINEFIYLSQLTQARAVRKNVEHLRCHSGINNGVLFWQLNDCCPAISWSCIDSPGRFKALYYCAKRVFAPVLITVSAKYDSAPILHKKTITSLTVSIINHSSKPLTGLFNCCLNNMNLKSIDKFQRPISVSPDDVISFSLPLSFVQPKEPEGYFLYLVLENDKAETAQNSFFYLPDKYINWPIQKINIQSRQIDGYNWLLKLRPLTAIKDLYIDTSFDAELSDNFFDLLTNKLKTVTIRTEERIDNLPDKISLGSVNSIFTT